MQVFAFHFSKVKVTESGKKTKTKKQTNKQKKNVGEAWCS